MTRRETQKISIWSCSFTFKQCYTKHLPQNVQFLSNYTLEIEILLNNGLKHINILCISEQITYFKLTNFNSGISVWIH